MLCINCTSRTLRIFFQDAFIPGLRSLQHRQRLQFQALRPLPLVPSYPRLSFHFYTVGQRNQSSLALGEDALTDDDYVPFVLTSTDLNTGIANHISGGKVLGNNESDLPTHDRSGWPPPAPMATVEKGEGADEWESEPNIELSDPTEPGEWAAAWGLLERDDGPLKGGQLGQGFGDLVPAEDSSGGGPTRRKQRSSKKEQMRLALKVKDAKRAAAQEKKAQKQAEREAKQLAKFTKAGIREKERLEKLELKAAKKKTKRLNQRKKWAALEAKQTEVTGEVEITEEIEVAGSAEISRGEVEEKQGQAEEEQVEVRVKMKVKRDRAIKPGLGRRLNRSTNIRLASRHSLEPHRPTPKLTKTSKGNSNIALSSPAPHKKTRASTHSPRELKPIDLIEPNPRGPSTRRDRWDLPPLEPDLEPTRLQKIVASKPRSELPAWMVEKARLQEKFGGAAWHSKKRLSPEALDGIRTLHKNHSEYTTPKLAELFKISPEVIRRVLRSKWERDPETIRKMAERWERRGTSVWERWVEKRVVQTKGMKKKAKRNRKLERETKWGLPDIKMESEETGLNRRDILRNII